MYVAGRVIKVERPVGSGNHVELQVGDPVPECTTWDTFKACINTGHVVWQPSLGETKVPEAVKHMPAQQVAPVKKGARA